MPSPKWYTPHLRYIEYIRYTDMMMSKSSEDNLQSITERLYGDYVTNEIAKLFSSKQLSTQMHREC